MVCVRLIQVPIENGTYLPPVEMTSVGCNSHIRKNLCPTEFGPISEQAAQVILEMRITYGVAPRGCDLRFWRQLRRLGASKTSSLRMGRREGRSRDSPTRRLWRSPAIR